MIRAAAITDAPLEPRRIPRVAEIQQAVCARFAVSMLDMVSRRRYRGVARPRQVAMFLAREMTALSFPQIALAFGGRDHTTVIHAYRNIDRLAERDVELSLAIELVKLALRDDLSVGAAVL